MTDDRPLCDWCRDPIPEGARRDAVTCSKRCRQARHRFRTSVGSASPVVGGQPRRLAYADPPYPGKSARYYGDHPDFGGEVDHAELIRRLSAERDLDEASRRTRGRVERIRTTDRVDGLIFRPAPRLTDPGRVTGAKPAEFCRWIFELLAAQPGDEFVDVFPGSGGVARAWEVYTSAAAQHDASRTTVVDGSKVRA